MIRIHSAFIEILEKTDMKLDSKIILEKLGVEGCNVDVEKRIVKFPSSIIREMVAKARKNKVVC